MEVTQFAAEAWRLEGFSIAWQQAVPACRQLFEPALEVVDVMAVNAREAIQF